MIISDPVFGFINIPSGLLRDIVKHPLFQRLAHIKQLGLASFVYPGAQHTRFQHSLGAYYLSTEALHTLSDKGVFLFDSEIEAVQVAILLHDVGHGPFSYVLEHCLVAGLSHEDITLRMIEQINREMHGALGLAIEVFKGTHPKRFLHQLICSQLDMDRLDYLCRDSFFTGVREGSIGAARIIRMLNVEDNRLVVESKGIYTLENYLMARRLMYWQVYLHKTSVACEEMLRAILHRAKDLSMKGEKLFATPALSFFLNNNVDKERFETDDDCLKFYSELDNHDLWSAVKQWQHSEDKVLALLSKSLINRNLFKAETLEHFATDEEMDYWRNKVAEAYDIKEEDLVYFVTRQTVSQEMYSPTSDPVGIVYPDGTTKNIADISELLSADFVEKKSQRHFLFHLRVDNN